MAGGKGRQQTRMGRRENRIETSIDKSFKEQRMEWQMKGHVEFLLFKKGKIKACLYVNKLLKEKKI